MFAGPNGSGKSTLIKEISKEFNVGYFINADQIEAALNSKKTPGLFGIFSETYI